MLKLRLHFYFFKIRYVDRNSPNVYRSSPNFRSDYTTICSSWKSLYLKNESYKVYSGILENFLLPIKRFRYMRNYYKLSSFSQTKISCFQNVSVLLDILRYQ